MIDRTAILTAALAEANRLQVTVSVAITDPGGHLLALWRMDGAPFHTATLAQDKAATAAGFGFATAAWKERISEQPHLLIGLNGRAGMIPIGGGLPLYHEGRLVAAIGVSGAKEQQDCQIAQAGAEACAVLGPRSAPQP